MGLRQMLTDPRRTTSMSVAGMADVCFGGLSLAFSVLVGTAVGIALLLMVLKAASAPLSDNHFRGHGFAASGVILALGVFALVSAIADSLLLTTGILILRLSRHARGFAIAYAAIVIPLAILDHWIAFGVQGLPPLLLPLTLFSPTYAVAQVAAFIVLPSWRQRFRTQRPFHPTVTT